MKKSSKSTVDPNQPTLNLRKGEMNQLDTGWRPTPVDQLPQDWSGAKRVGLDFESHDEHLSLLGPGIRRGAESIGYSFCLQDDGPHEQWPRFYVPYNHGIPGQQSSLHNLDQRACIGYLRDRFKTYTGEVVGANLAYDLDWAWEHDVEMPLVSRFADVQVADPLINELEQGYSLEAIGQRRKIGGKSETLLRQAAAHLGLDPKKDMWLMNSASVGVYAQDDAVLPIRIYMDQLREIEDQRLQQAWDLECKVLPILVRMTRKGVRINSARLDHVEEWCRRIEEQMCAEIRRLSTVKEFAAGCTGDAKLLKRVLEAVGLDHLIGKTDTGKESYAKDIFAGVDHPVAKALLRARQVVTIRNTFINGLREHRVGAGRIHCTFNQIRKTEDDGSESGVGYGRLSASHVNMQNQPGNSRFSGDNELGPMWRSVYEAEKDEEWAALDLKQQEPKWSFHYGALLEQMVDEYGNRIHPNCKGAVALCEKLRADPSLDTYEPIVDLAGVPRSKAKVIWLARAYGKGDGNLCIDLGYPVIDVVWSRAKWGPVPVDSEEGQRLMEGGSPLVYKGAGPEGQAFIDKFELELSFLKYSAKAAKKAADERGYVRLLSGRRCHFEKGDGGKYVWTHKAFNRLIQGTSAEQTKRIMVAVDEAGYGHTLMLQVHDEIDCSIGDRKHVPIISEVMRTATPELLVPTVVDVEIGPSWGESMMVEYNDCSGRKSKLQYKWGLHIVDGVPVYGENP